MICYGTGPRVPEIHSTHNLALGGGCTKTTQVLHGFRNVKKKGSFQDGEMDRNGDSWDFCFFKLGWKSILNILEFEMLFIDVFSNLTNFSTFHGNSDN